MPPTFCSSWIGELRGTYLHHTCRPPVDATLQTSGPTFCLPPCRWLQAQGLPYPSSIPKS